MVERERKQAECTFSYVGIFFARGRDGNAKERGHSLSLRYLIQSCTCCDVCYLTGEKSAPKGASRLVILTNSSRSTINR